ncbi:hypothetical protein, partial [Deinococcus pimensis]|uniref:hypothetical protein n=1 Tax=Deinococcus pimensis TaxID=309888 RepID=UPI00048404FA
MRRAALPLLPALLVTVGLFGGGLVLALLQSVGLLTGAEDAGGPTWRAYREALGSPQFLPSLLLGAWIALVSTALALVLGTL